jgi:hypothetical protein
MYWALACGASGRTVNHRGGEHAARFAARASSRAASAGQALP